MVEQSPTAPGFGGLGSQAPRGGPSGAHADTSSVLASQHPHARSHIAGTPTGTIDAERRAWWPRAGRALLRLFRDRIWPGPWAGERLEESSEARRRTGAPGRPGGVRDLPGTALRSGVLIDPVDALTARDWSRSRGLRAGDPIESWEAVGVLGACFLLTGEPSAIVIERCHGSDTGHPESSVHDRSVAAGHGPGSARRAGRRGSWRRRTTGDQCLGVRWAREAGFTVVSRARGSGDPGVDLCLAAGPRDPSRGTLHTLACDAAAVLRPGGLLVVTVALREGGGGIAELRAALAESAEAGFDLVGDLDESAQRLAAARHSPDPGLTPGHSRRATAWSPLARGRRRSSGPASRPDDEQVHGHVYAYVRLMQRYRGPVR